MDRTNTIRHMLRNMGPESRSTVITTVILIAFATANLIIVVTYKYPDLSPIKVFNQMYWRKEGLLHNSTSEKIKSKDEQRYEEMTEEYNITLASIPRHQYHSSDTYIDIGPPISSLLNVPPQISAQPKLILLWTPFFGKVDWVSEATLHGCPVTCHITTNKSDLPYSGALVMHPRDLPKGRKSLPVQHLTWQYWIYLLQESPYHTGINVGDYNNIFNWTATFRLDSDIYAGYGGLERRLIPMETEKLDNMVSDIIKSKTKLVAVRIGNCDRTKTNRLRYIAELKRYIPVDFYGGCGNIPCSRKEGCDAELNQYKFYLAFENSHCRDYITEKFWLSLNTWRSVPVVMGAAPEDYQAVAPNQAFMHTDGFKSPKFLAEYLQLLDKNVGLYKRYFSWHKYWQPRSGPSWVCNICKALYNVSTPIKSYRDFKGWYREDYCKV